jgi:Ni2+-binding GTPase involved in maturation of urease and hydrogenase
MYTNITEADVKVIEAKVDLMKKINRLLAAMQAIQNNVNQLAERIVKLEEKQK